MTGAREEDPGAHGRKRLFLSIGAAVLVAMVVLEYGPLLAGRIPFRAQLVVQFPVWDGVRPVLPEIRQPEQGDIATQFFPWRVHVVEEWHRLRVPLWNDALLFGCPMLANDQSAVFDPINLLAALLPPRRSWGAAIPFRPLLAGAGAAILVDALGGTNLGAWMAGIVFAFSGFLAGWRGRPQESTGMWLPVALFAVDRLARRRGAVPILFAAAIGALPVLGGHPEVGFQMMTVVAAFALFRLAGRRDGQLPAGGRGAYAGRVLLAGGGATVLSLVQIGPTLEWIPQLWRLFHSWGHLPLDSIGMLLSRDRTVSPEHASYAGFITLFLVPFALWQRKNRGDVLFFSVLLVAAIEIAFGLPPFYQLSQNLPVLSGLPNGRFLLAADLALAVLAGLGFSFLERRDPGRASALPPLLASAGLAAIVAWLVAPDRPRLGGDAHAGSWSAELFVTLGIGAVLFFATAKSRRATWGVVALFVAASDLFTFQHRQLVFTEARNVFPPAPALEFLRDRTPEGERIATLDVTMGSNFEMMYGLRTPTGYDFLVQRTARMLRPFGVTQTQVGASAAALADPASAGILDLLGVRYLLATTYNASSSILERQPSRFSLVYRTRSIRVFENPRALPRAFFLPQSAVRRYATEPEEARAVFAPAFDPRRTLVLSGTAAAPEEARSSAEAVVPGEDFTETPGEASFVLDVPSRGFAVVSESAYPGWRAWVDGRPADVLRADYALQAVAVGPGRHRLVLRYRPPVFWTCFAISAGAWLALAVFTLRSRLRSPPKEMRV
jgi:hypothetical protein